jgi:hypothetical protein
MFFTLNWSQFCYLVGPDPHVHTRASQRAAVEARFREDVRATSPCTACPARLFSSKIGSGKVIVARRGGATISL